jgi:hypothetical protein
MVPFQREEPEGRRIANYYKGFAGRLVLAVQAMIRRRNIMKKILSVSVVVLMLIASYSFAQTDSGMKGEQKGEMKQQGMKMDEGMMKEMMEKCKPMMKQMMVDGMMKKEMMQMMMGMMDMQEKMMKGPKAAEKKQMMKDMAQMKEKMQRMMSMPMDMAEMDDSQSKLTCAGQWLKKAIDLHDVHMKDPKTATEASQMEMMDQMKKAYGCISEKGTDMSGTQSKEAEGKEPKKTEPSRTDPHKH